MTNAIPKVYLDWVHDIRDHVDSRKFTYTQGQAALAELARILGEDAGVRSLWMD